ncbi:MAG: Two-component system response regulator protein [Firmicutes bacterium]|nr:Two-component system response regulator protein [Bacillota bacterium]
MSKRILIADDEKNMVWAFKKALKDEKYQIISASNGIEAVEKIKTEDLDLILMDIKMPKLDGMGVLQEIRSLNLNTPVIMITAHGTTESAVQAMKMGALDYISKPFDVEELKIQLRKALDVKDMKEQIQYLKEELESRTGRLIIGDSPVMKRVLDIVYRVAPTNATVLITGESGTGKEMIANAIHYNSERKDKPYIKVNCGAIPESLMESELFGHERGAFTGAVSRKPGRFERANGGTIFLDEVGELSAATQVKLLRVLQEKQIERVGGTDVIDIDIRVIAATNRDLKSMLEEGAFREDLYYRLNVMPIELPPLRERKEDIPKLIMHFLDRFCSEMGRGALSLSEEAMDALVKYDWKGNIRELENIVERLVLLSQGKEISRDDLPNEILYSGDGAIEFKLPDGGVNLEDVEKSLIKQALERSGHNQTRAAELLGITRHTLIYRMGKYGL